MMLEGFSKGPTTRSGPLRHRVVPGLLAASLVGMVAATSAAAVSTPPPEGSHMEAGTAVGSVATALVVFGTEEDADTIVAEVARTEEERARGLMFREELGEDAGMLFVLPNYEEISFWMKDTYIPLDVAFMDPTFRITGIREMEPESEELVDSPGRIQFALEVNRGWFEEHGVEVNDRARVYFGG